MRLELEALRDKYMEIMRIFTVISNAPADQKVSVIEENRPIINQIESAIKRKDDFISARSQRMRQAQNRTVLIEGL